MLGNIVFTHLGAGTLSYNKQNYFICLNRPHSLLLSPQSSLLLTLKGRPRLSGFILDPCHDHTGFIGWLHFNCTIITRMALNKVRFQWFNLQDELVSLSLSFSHNRHVHTMHYILFKKTKEVVT